MALVQLPAPVVDSGSMTVLATGTLSGTEVSLTSISGIYQSLFLSLSGVIGSASTPLKIRINNVDSSDYRGTFSSAGGTGWAGYTTESTMNVSNATNVGTSSTNLISTLTINRYALTGYKTYLTTFASSSEKPTFGFTHAEVTAAVTSLQIRLNGSATFSAGTYTLYGVK